MAKTVTISDDLATLVEERAKKAGYSSIDAAAEALIAESLAANDLDDDDLNGLTSDQVRALIDEADASGPLEPWDPDALRREILAREAKQER